jgi:hypothetical protein
MTAPRALSSSASSACRVSGALAATLSCGGAGGGAGRWRSAAAVAGWCVLSVRQRGGAASAAGQKGGCAARRTLDAAVSASRSVLSSTSAVLGSHAAVREQRGAGSGTARRVSAGRRGQLRAEAQQRCRGQLRACARTVAGAPPRGVHVVVRPLVHRLLAVLVDALPVGVLGGPILCQLAAL